MNGFMLKGANTVKNLDKNELMSILKREASIISTMDVMKASIFLN